MGINTVQVTRAGHLDVRVLAALDSCRTGERTDGDYILERRTYWKERFALEHEQGTETYIARNGGLNLGYLALLRDGEAPIVDVCLGPKANPIEAVTKALFEKAGIAIPEPIPVSTADSMAVA